MPETITLYPSQSDASVKAQPIPFTALRRVVLRLLWDCNLRCIMCPHPYMAKSEMQVETAHKVLDQLTHPVWLNFIGGEPCLWLLRHPEVLQRALDEGKHYVNLSTNGILLTRLPFFVDAFRDHPVSVQFSIDGYEESYEHVRKRSSWPKLVEAIRAVHSKRLEGNNRRAAITVNYVLLKSTLADLPKCVRFCAREGVDELLLQYGNIYQTMIDLGTITKDESVYNHPEATDDAIGEAIEVARAEGLSLRYPDPLGRPTVAGFQRVHRRPLPVTSMIPGQIHVPNHGEVLCKNPWHEIHVYHDGTILPCCCGVGKGPTIGHIDDGLENIWNGRQITDVRRSIEADEMHPNCSGCSLYPQALRVRKPV